MQVLHWLLKATQEPPKEADHISSSKNRQGEKGDRDITVVKKPAGRKKPVERTGLDCSSFSLFRILRRKDIAKACFYSSIHSKSVEADIFIGSMKMTKEDLARGLGMISHKVENKVLPITEHEQCSTPQGTTAPEKKEKAKGDKSKAISKMKELLRWAATAKAETKGGRYISRKVLQFRNRSALKSVPDDEQMSNDSPKISFRWEVESCSTVSSSYSAISSIASSRNFDHKSICSNLQPSLSSTPIHDLDMEFVRPGNWITTDSEFVVLEL